MYYPESAIIASEHSHRADDIQRIDTFLFERHGNGFYAGTAADALRIKLSDIQGILNLYKNAGVLTERKVWLCPKHREEIDPVRDDVFHCPTCGRDYREEQCERAVLYTARRIEVTDKTPAPESIPSESENTEDTIKSPATRRKLALPHLPRLNEPWAIIIAAIIGFIAVIVAALLSSNSNSNAPITEPSPTVIYTETATLTPTMTTVPSETVDIRSRVVTATSPITTTETPSTDQP